MRTAQDIRPRTAVLLQFTGIGDLIWHIQYFKLLAQQSRGGQVTIVAQPSTLAKAFIGQEPWVAQIIDHDHRPRREEKRRGKHAGLLGMYRMACELRQGQFDRLIVFSGRISRGLIAYMSRIPTRLGYGYRWLQRLCLTEGPYIAPYEGPSLAVYQEASAFMVAHGFCPTPIRPQLQAPEALVHDMQARLADLPRPLFALVIGTSEPHKQWGQENFAALARRLTEQSTGSVLLLGGPAETSLARDIATQVGSAARHRVAIITDASPLGSAAALHIADVCVGNDTGMINVAAAVDTPSYVLLGARQALAHDPAYLHNIRARSLADITVDQVLPLLLNAPLKATAQT
jgi:heptosyltransferase II